MLDARRAAIVLALACLPATSLLARQQASGPSDQVSKLYPAARAEQVVRYMMIETDEPKLGPLKDALTELGASVIYGPRTTKERPGRAFFALSAPWDLSPKLLERAGRKAGAAAEELTCTAFEGREGRDTPVTIGPLTFSSRDFVMSITGEIVWFDSIGGWSQFYGPPGKLQAKDLLARYEKLYAPYGGGSLGRLVHESFTWTLPSAPDEKVAAKLQKAVRKLDGVHAVTLEGATLTVEVVLADIAAAAPAGAISGGMDASTELDAAGAAAPRAAWCTRPLWDLLESLGLAPVG
jgi:hypothetical protein